MMRAILLLLFGMAPTLVAASGGEIDLRHARIDMDDKPSLQRGAKLFVNYCMGCHSLAYLRYNRLASDLGLSNSQVRDNLVIGGAKIGETMTVAMRDEDSAAWFGTAPPDLSVISRVRGADWLFTYLTGFYADDNPSRPFGVNNIVFKDVAMPHVLWRQQGVQHAVLGEPDESGVRPIEGLELAVPGEMHPEEFDRAMTDLTNFLVYAGEPAQLSRARVGPWVLLFLALLFVLSRALYKEYWRDVH